MKRLSEDRKEYFMRRAGYRAGLILLIIAAFALNNPLRLSAAGQTRPRDIPGWYLVWHDEFDGDTLDETKWRVEDAALVKNNELQYYTPEDVYVSDGVLVLRSQKRPMGGRAYTSGLVETKGKFARQYGRFEVRARLPKGKGIWPAHWMMTEAGTWPPEIDIMEMLGHNTQVVYMSLHWGVWPKKGHKTQYYRLEEGVPDFSEAFHTFAVEWEPGEIRWYVNGNERFKMNQHIPQEPFFIILNTAVGGDWPGNPNSRTRFPQYHEIDYVRVYAKEVPGHYFLTAGSAEGVIDIKPKEMMYPAQTTVTLEARPFIGFEFSRWSGDASGDANPLSLTMDGHKNITAHFVPARHGPQLLSRGKHVRASSVEAAHLGPENAVDGELKTRWSSEFSDTQWFRVDLGKQCFIEAVRLRWEVAYGKSYEIQVSDNGREWTTVYATTSGKGGVDEITQLNVPGRYVSVYGVERGTQFGYSLWEFEVFGRENP